MTRRTEEQMRETIEWVPASERMPDADESVLIYEPDANDAVAEGWFDGDRWRDHLGTDDMRVTHWCAMPNGPSK